MTITPSAVIELGPELQGSYFVGLSRGFDSNWLILSSNQQFWRRPDSCEPMVPPFFYQLHVHDGYAWHPPLAIGPTARRYSFSQALPDRKWLFAEARAVGEQSPNADVFAEDGRLLASLFLGDGIEHVQVSSCSDIWVGYFDEGVYGGGKLEHSGLVCFDQDGNPRLRFWPEITDSYALPPVDDLYALNVCGNGDVWCCYYSDFPLVRLKGRQFGAVWPDFPGKPMRALAVNGTKLLIVPAYTKSGPLDVCDLERQSVIEEQFTDFGERSIEYDLVTGRDVTLGFVSLSNPTNPLIYQVDFR